MRRLAGIALLLAGSVLLLVGAALLFAAILRPLPYTILGGLLAAAVIALAVFVLRRAARVLALPRAAFAGAVALVVVVLLGAILGPSMLSTRQRAPQLRTMSDLRSIAAALEERATAVHAYPPAATLQELEPFLTPTYLRALPQNDHWGHPLRYEWQGPATAPDWYAIGSAGRDGIWQRPRLRDYTSAATTNFDDDIVFANANFVQFPDPGPGPE